jgi:prefoldin subunit 5
VAVFKKYLGIEEYLRMDLEEKKGAFLSLSLELVHEKDLEEGDRALREAKNKYESLREPYKNRQKSIKQRMSTLLSICDIDMPKETGE